MGVGGEIAAEEQTDRQTGTSSLAPTSIFFVSVSAAGELESLLLYL